MIASKPIGGRQPSIWQGDSRDELHELICCTFLGKQAINMVASGPQIRGANHKLWKKLRKELFDLEGRLDLNTPACAVSTQQRVLASRAGVGRIWGGIWLRAQPHLFSVAVPKPTASAPVRLSSHWEHRGSAGVSSHASVSRTVLCLRWDDPRRGSGLLMNSSSSRMNSSLDL